MRIAAVGREAAEAMAAVHAAAFPPGWSAAEIRALFARPGAFALLAAAGRKAGGRAAGFIFCGGAGPDHEILTFAVRPEYRNRGLGARLLEAAAARAAAEGASRLLLEVAEDNAPALALYRRHGFVEVGRRPRYYRAPDGGAVAAVVMGRRLCAGG